MPVEAIARALSFDKKDLCQACITGDYPTPVGRELYQIALKNTALASNGQRTYEGAGTAKEPEVVACGRDAGVRS